MSEDVLIYTIKGNVPESTLNYSHEWEDHLECEGILRFSEGKPTLTVHKKGYLVFKEFYHDKETGELVKENRHVYLAKGQESESSQGTFGGT